MKTSVAGTGRIAWSLELDPLRYKPCTHIGALCALAKKGEPIEWTGLCDTSPEKTRGALNFIRKQSHKKATPLITTDYRELIAALPDLLVIAADTNVHFEILKMAVQKGIPRIVTEKPIVLTPAEAGKLRELASRGKSMIWVNYERRYHPKYLQIHSWVHDNPVYGKALYYRGWLGSNLENLYPNKKGEGILLHDTTHLLDLAFFIFGQGSARQISPKERKTSSLIEIIHNQNSHEPLFGEILTTAKTPVFHLEMEIIFEKARIRCGNGFLHIEKSQKSPYYKGFFSLGSPKIIPDKKMVFKDNPFIRLYTDVLTDRPPGKIIEEACANIVALTAKNTYNKSL